MAACTLAMPHGSGSSRLSPRNVAVAKLLQGAGLGTLLFDLLEPFVDLVETLVHALLQQLDLLFDLLGASSTALAQYGSSPTSSTSTRRGMGSSAMGASVLRKKIQSAGFADVTVVNKAISTLTDTWERVTATIPQPPSAPFDTVVVYVVDPAGRILLARPFRL